MDLLELLTSENLPKNEIVRDNFIKAYKIVNDPKYHNIMCSISGGSDSDIMLDIIHKVDINRKVKYVWFDTGLEYSATKRHLDYLEKRYDIEIVKIRAKTPIPLTCKKYGQPFLSKAVSKNIESLQKYNFDFSKEVDNDYIRMIKTYCIANDHKTKNSVEIDGKWYIGCVGAILWWCDVCEKLPWGTDKSNNNMFRISRNKHLKEFMIENPPTFNISSKCCTYAKKNPSHDFIKNNNIDLVILGIRKAEGGVRSTSYKNCYDSDRDDYDKYRPIFWYTNGDKLQYDEVCNIVHSDCYKIWGFPRTGCCGCPYAQNLEHELEATKIYEPKLYNAIQNVFRDSYEYTKRYREFQQEINIKEKGRKRLF